MFELIRDAFYRAITTTRGDSLLPVRVPKDLVRRLNVTLGRPLAPKDELATRARARARLVELRSGGREQAPSTERAPGQTAPVLLYFEKDRNVRELTRIEEALAAKGLDYKRLDVSGDEATIEFVIQRAHCERDDLPIVFVADAVVGNYDALVRADVSGELDRLLRGAPVSAQSA